MDVMNKKGTDLELAYEWRARALELDRALWAACWSLSSRTKLNPIGLRHRFITEAGREQ